MYIFFGDFTNTKHTHKSISRRPLHSLHMHGSNAVPTNNYENERTHLSHEPCKFMNRRATQTCDSAYLMTFFRCSRLDPKRHQ